MSVSDVQGHRISQKELIELAKDDPEKAKRWLQARERKIKRDYYYRHREEFLAKMKQQRDLQREILQNKSESRIEIVILKSDKIFEL